MRSLKYPNRSIEHTTSERKIASKNQKNEKNKRKYIEARSKLTRRANVNRNENSDYNPRARLENHS